MSNDDALDALIATAMAHDQPPDGAEDQAWAAFAGGLGGGGGGSGAAVPAAAKGLALKVVLGVAAASAVTVGVLQATGEPAPVSSVAATDDAAPTPSPAPEPAAALPRAAPSSPAVSPSPVRASRPSKPLSRRAPRDPEPQTRAQPAAEDASTLAEEARRVGALWNALDRGDATEALALADAYRARFPDGTLQFEARAAALAARCQLGRPLDLSERERVEAGASAAVLKRISAACRKKHDEPKAAAATPGHD